MAATINLIIASFTTPLQLGPNPQLMLWVLPLAAAIAVVYKTNKLPTINTATLFKESAALFASIVVFMALVALGLYAIARLFIQ